MSEKNVGKESIKETDEHSNQETSVSLVGSNFQNYGWIHKTPNEIEQEREVQQDLQTENVDRLNESTSLNQRNNHPNENNTTQVQSDSFQSNSIGSEPISQQIIRINNSIDETDYLPSFEAATSHPSAPPLNIITENENNSILNQNEDGDNNITHSIEVQENVPSYKIFNSSLKTIEFKVNLVRAAKRLLTFLKLVDAQGDLYEGEKVKASIYR